MTTWESHTTLGPALAGVATMIGIFAIWGYRISVQKAERAVADGQVHVGDGAHLSEAHATALHALRIFRAAGVLPTVILLLAAIAVSAWTRSTVVIAAAIVAISFWGALIVYSRRKR